MTYTMRPTWPEEPNDCVFRFGGEDVDFNWRVQQAGYTVYFDPSIKVHHHHRPTLRGFVNQHYMYGRAYYLVRRKWPEMYCVYPHALRRPKDVLKAGHFVAGLFYQPAVAAGRVPGWRDRAAALPLLFLAHFAWKFGMVEEWLRRRKRKTTDGDAPVSVLPHAVNPSGTAGI